MTKQALGRGFEGLIPTSLQIDAVAAPGESVKQLAITSIVQNPDQPRKSFDENALIELAESIKQHGIIQPLVVTPSGSNKYRIVAGERRYRAAKIAGITKVPAIIRNHKELEELEIALVENVQRVDLSPLEQAVSIVRLRDQFSLPLQEIAKKLGKAETTVSNIVRLLQLPKSAIEALQKNTITEGHARAILALKTDEKLQNELLNKIIAQKLSVREAEDFVKEHRSEKAKKIVSYSPEVSKIVSHYSEKLPKTLKIKEKKGSAGSIVVSYSSLQELQDILRRMTK